MRRNKNNYPNTSKQKHFIVRIKRQMMLSCMIKYCLKLFSSRQSRDGTLSIHVKIVKMKISKLTIVEYQLQEQRKMATNQIRVSRISKDKSRNSHPNFKYNVLMITAHKTQI